MRDFYKKCLDRTYEIFGVHQTDEEKMSEEDVKFLLDGLCKVSKNYSYIPEIEQKKIISACMLSDRTYRNINLRLVAGWLELNGKKWFTEIAHKESKEPENYKPLEGVERDAMLKMWQDTLNQMNENFIEAMRPKHSGSKMREHFDDIAPIPEKPEEIYQQKNPNNNPVKSFLIDGFEIYAKDEQDAMRIFIENFGQPKDETVNKQGSEGIGEATGLSDDQNNTPQRNENFETEDKH